MPSETETYSRDAEKQQDEGRRKHGEATREEGELQDPSTDKPAFKSLGLLDRYLFVWIFLSMVIGILLGNFVPSTAEALQKGKFVDVSVPIGNANPCCFPSHQVIPLSYPT